MDHKEQIRNIIAAYATDKERTDIPPISDKNITLKMWVGMLYDGLAYGNWPWKIKP